MLDDYGAGQVPTALPQTSTNERTAHHRRRRQRNREDIWAVLAEAPEPFGLFAPAHYRDLGSWEPAATAEDDESTAAAMGPIDWLAMPPTCEPCALLNNPANRGKKHGKTVLEQIGLMQYDRVSEAALTPAPTPTAADASSGTPTTAGDPRQLEKRGMHKRWQVRK